MSRAATHGCPGGGRITPSGSNCSAAQTNVGGATLGGVVAAGSTDVRWPTRFDDSRFRRDDGYTPQWTIEAGFADIAARTQRAAG